MRDFTVSDRIAPAIVSSLEHSKPVRVLLLKLRQCNLSHYALAQMLSVAGGVAQLDLSYNPLVKGFDFSPYNKLQVLKL